MLGLWGSLPVLQGVSRTTCMLCSMLISAMHCLDTPGILWKFIVGSIIMVLGLPIFGVTGASLYSKLLPPSIQGICHKFLPNHRCDCRWNIIIMHSHTWLIWPTGFGQGIRRSVFSTAAILGPLWAGSTVSLSYYVLLAVPCGLLLFVTVCMLQNY